jgi:hypothetical protein
MVKSDPEEFTDEKGKKAEHRTLIGVPTVFCQNGYRVSFYSYDLKERVHVHVFKAGSECKLWVHDLTISFNRGFRPREIAEIRRLVSGRREEIVAKWQEHERM